jgi:transcriptional regulator GlxA family with amidase domain
MSETPQRLQIAIVLFEGVDAQDAVGPYEVLRWLPGAEVALVASTPGPKRSERGKLALLADQGLDAVPRPDVVIVPGGSGELQARDDRALIAWLQRVHETSAWTASVCTGALLLGAAGILRGKRATTHWTAIGELAQFGATAVSERYVFDGKLVTAAGVSAGIDMAIALAARIAGPEVAQSIQLGIEYDPAPPLDAGNAARAPAAVREAVLSRVRAREAAGARTR